MLLPYYPIRDLAQKGMIDPFEPEQVREVCTQDYPPRKVISYGLTSFGYDLRCSDDFRIFTNINSSIIDPKRFSPRNFIQGQVETFETSETSEVRWCVIPPNSYALTASLERFVIPRNLLVLCIGKSTYARCGIIINVTPLEPEWEGHLTIEISNSTPLPCKIYCGEGIGQLLFFQGAGAPETSYKDRNGKYQDQAAEPVIAKV